MHVKKKFLSMRQAKEYMQNLQNHCYHRSPCKRIGSVALGKASASAVMVDIGKKNKTFGRILARQEEEPWDWMESESNVMLETYFFGRLGE